METTRKKEEIPAMAAHGLELRRPVEENSVPVLSTKHTWSVKGLPQLCSIHILELELDGY